MRSTLLTCLLVFAAACGSDGSTTPEPQPQPEPPSFRDAPETVPREITLGTIVHGEALHNMDDVDEFVFTAPPGGMVTLLASVENGAQGLFIAVIDSVTSQSAATNTFRGQGPGGALFADVVPGRRWLVRVYALTGAAPGPYTLTVHAVNRHPEAGDSVLPPGSWVHGAIEPFYDVDEFVFDGVAGQEINLFAQSTDPHYIRAGLRLRLRSPAGGAWIVDHPATSGVIRLPATGRYRVRMVLDPATSGSPYPYRVMFYPIVRTPEGVSAVLVDGQPVREVLQMPGDVDEYTFTAQQGEFFRLNVAVEGYEHVSVVVHEAATGERLDVDLQRFAAPRSGTYSVTISHGERFPAVQPLPYSLEMVRVDMGPEGVAATIALGDTVSEALTPAGDIDEYTFTGTEGTEVVILVEAPAYASVDLYHPETGERLTRVTSWLTEGGLSRHASQRIRLPITGQYRVRVWHDLDAQTQLAKDAAVAAAISPAYRFSVVPVSRAPETVPASIAIGDTVTETLSPKRDLDIFTFTAQAGEPLVLWAETLTYTSNGPVAIFVTRADRPEAIAYWFSGWGPYTFTAPVTGGYRVGAWSASAAGLQDSPVEQGDFEGTYRFSVRRPAP